VSVPLRRGTLVYGGIGETETIPASNTSSSCSRPSLRLSWLASVSSQSVVPVHQSPAPSLAVHTLAWPCLLSHRVRARHCVAQRRPHLASGSLDCLMLCPRFPFPHCSLLSVLTILSLVRGSFLSYISASRPTFPRVLFRVSALPRPVSLPPYVFLSSFDLFPSLCSLVSARTYILMRTFRTATLD
jgi:hypothetical protein